jgi:hypothetical protein
MRITYSRSIDVLDIELLPEGRTQRMVKLGPTCNADLDAKGRLIAIEILDASAWYSKQQLEQLEEPMPEYLTLAEAAAESKIAPVTLRAQIANGRLVATKRGRDWLVARHELWNYLEKRAPTSGSEGSGHKGSRRGAARL